MLYSVYPYIHWNYPPHAHSALRILRCGAAAPVGGRLRQDHHGGEGAAHHIPHHQVGGPPPIFGGIDRRGGARGDGGVEDFCGRGEDEFARGKHPGGMVLFKKKLWEDVREKWKWDVCRSFICFFSRIWFLTSKLANVIRATRQISINSENIRLFRRSGKRKAQHCILLCQFCFFFFPMALLSTMLTLLTLPTFPPPSRWSFLSPTINPFYILPGRVASKSSGSYFSAPGALRGHTKL